MTLCAHTTPWGILVHPKSAILLFFSFKIWCSKIAQGTVFLYNNIIEMFLKLNVFLYNNIIEMFLKLNVN